MFFKPQPGLGPQCPICAGADMLLSIACQRTQESGWKKQKRTKTYADQVIIRFYSITYCCFKTSANFPEHASKYFLRNIWQSTLSMPARFRRIIHQQAQISLFETLYSKPESLTIVEIYWIAAVISMVFTKLLLETALATRPCNCEAVSEPLLPKVARCIPVLPSRYIGQCAAGVLKRSGYLYTSRPSLLFSVELKGCGFQENSSLFILFISTAKPISLVRGYIEVKTSKHDI